MTKDEQQALVNEDAPYLRFIHNTIAAMAANGDKNAQILLPMVAKLHVDAATLIVANGLTVPADGSGGVIIMSGGGGK